MTLEEIREIEDEIINKGIECPFALDDPSCQCDLDWDAEYSAFCSDRLNLLTVEDWVKVAYMSDLEILPDHLLEYAGKMDLSQLASVDLVVLLTSEPKLPTSVI